MKQTKNQIKGYNSFKDYKDFIIKKHHLKNIKFKIIDDFIVINSKLNKIMNTINNTQVNVKDLTIQEIQELAEGLPIWKNERSLVRTDIECYFTKFESDHEFYVRVFSKTKVTVTFDEFLKLKAL
jgi:hypothetical protein